MQLHFMALHAVTATPTTGEAEKSNTVSCLRTQYSSQSPDHLNVSVVVFDVVVTNAASVVMPSQSASLSHLLDINMQLRQTLHFVIIVQIMVSSQLYHSQLVFCPSSA